MKYIITEDQENRFSKIVETFLNDMEFPHVSEFMIDYNEEMNRFDVNILWDRESFLRLGPYQNSVHKKVVKKIGLELGNMFPEVKFTAYDHFK
jgi:hypothetical protein